MYPSTPLPHPSDDTDTLGVEGLPLAASELLLGRLYALIDDAPNPTMRLLADNLPEGVPNRPLIVASSHAPTDWLDTSALRLRQADGTLLVLPTARWLPANISASRARKLLGEIESQHYRAFGRHREGVVVIAPANALLDRHNNAATEESLEALRYWARDKGHALLLIFSFEADIHTRLNFHADSLAGLASLLPGPSGAIFDLHHWLSSEGIAGAEARQLIVPRRGKIIAQSKKTAAVAMGDLDDFGRVLVLSGCETGLGYLPPLWEMFTTFEDLHHTCSGARTATIALPFQMDIGAKVLTEQITQLRQSYGDALKIVVREIGRQLRGSEERALLMAGANLVVPANVGASRFLGMVRGFQHTLCRTFELQPTATHTTDHPEAKGYLPLSQFIEEVESALMRGEALAIDSQLIALTPDIGLTVLEAIHLCQFNRAGDMCTTDGKQVWVFLFACWENDTQTALDRLFSLPISSLFSGETRLPDLRSIREALQKLYRHADKAPDLRAALAAATPEEGGGGLTLTPHKTHTTRFVAIPATRHPLPLKVSQ